MKRRGRPPSFTREELIATARALGPDGIGLQQVAAALGVSRTCQYSEVRDQAELGELVLAELVLETTTDWVPEPGASWSSWLDAYARALRRCLLSGGEWLRYGTGRLFYSPAALRNADRLLAAMVAAGFSLEDATHAFVFVSELVYANVRSVTDMRPEAGRDEFLAQLRSLDDVPVLRKAAGVIGRTSLERQFEYDLATALAGLQYRVVDGSVADGHRTVQNRD